MKKNSSIGLTDAPIIGVSDAWRKFRRPVGLSLLEASWNQVKSLYITGWTDGPKQSTGALDVLCSREHVWWTSTRLQHRLNRRLRINHRCIGCTMFQKACLSWSVNLFSTGWTDAPTDHAPVQWRKPRYCVRTPQRLLFGHRETGWTDAFKFSPVGSSDGHDFSAVDFQRLCDPLHSI